MKKLLLLPLLLLLLNCSDDKDDSSSNAFSNATVSVEIDTSMLFMRLVIESGLDSFDPNATTISFGYTDTTIVVDSFKLDSMSISFNGVENTSLLMTHSLYYDSPSNSDIEVTISNPNWGDVTRTVKIPKVQPIVSTNPATLEPGNFPAALTITTAPQSVTPTSTAIHFQADASDGTFLFLSESFTGATCNMTLNQYPLNLYDTIVDARISVVVAVESELTEFALGSSVRTDASSEYYNLQ